MENVLTEAKGNEIILDGKTYRLSPLNLNTMAALEEAFNCSLDKLMEKFGDKQASAFRLLLFTLLRENHPELTLESVGKIVPIEKLPELSDLIAKVMTAK